MAHRVIVCTFSTSKDLHHIGLEQGENKNGNTGENTLAVFIAVNMHVNFCSC